MKTLRERIGTRGRLLAAALLGMAAGAGLEAAAASLGTETFGGPGTSGWVDRDALVDMNVDYNAGIGHVVAGSLQGSFDPQGSPLSETDAFRANSGSSGGMFTGDYWTDVPTFGSWSFSFMSDDVLPSDLIVRFSNGTDLFLRSVLSQVTAGLDNWYSVTVPLTYAGWVGGSAAAFSNALSNVTFVDVQVTRNGTGAQDFFVDNFSLNAQSGGGGGGGAIPEPTTAGLLLASLAVLRAARRRGSRTREALRSLWVRDGHSPSDFDGVPAPASSPRRRRRSRRMRKAKMPLIY